MGFLAKDQITGYVNPESDLKTQISSHIDIIVSYIHDKIISSDTQKSPIELSKYVEDYHTSVKKEFEIVLTNIYNDEINRYILKDGRFFFGCICN